LITGVYIELATAADLALPSPEWILAWATVALALATVLIIVFSYRHEKDLVDEQKRLVEEQRNLVKTQKEQYQLEVLVVIFQLLDDNAHRNARRRLINLYTDDSDKQRWGTLRLMNVVKKDAGYDEHFLQSNYLESSNIVKADFNHMGALIKSELIEKRQFLESYWIEVLKCARSLRNDLNESSMKNFKYLRQEAEEYRKKYHGEEPSPLDMSKDEFRKKFRDVGEISLV
jgi:hypothetical protein